MPRQKKSLFRHHASVRPVSEAEYERLSDDSSTGFDLTQVPVQPSVAGGNQDTSRSCPVPPQRCPFGGACHSCPPHVQAKLKIGQPGDKYEQEADRVAEQVMRMPEPSVQRKPVCSSCKGKKDAEDKLLQAKPLVGQITSLVQRKPEPEAKKDEDEDKILQAKAVDSTAAGSQVDHPLIQSVLSSPGQPLDMATRSFMEPRFGQDFSGVRVHTDGQAAESARAVNARAYTVGRDVVFGAGEYAPGSGEGRRLMAHELTHVMQQKSHNLRREPAQKGGGGQKQTAPMTFYQKLYVVRDSSISLGGGQLVTDLAAFKAHVMHLQNTGTWTLVLAIHGALDRIAAQEPPNWQHNAVFYTTIDINGEHSQKVGENGSVVSILRACFYRYFYLDQVEYHF